MKEHANETPHTPQPEEPPATGLVDRPMTRVEALSMRGFGWDGDLDQMRSDTVDAIDTAIQR
jgi:hypothetical protein